MKANRREVWIKWHFLINRRIHEISIFILLCSTEEEEAKREAERKLEEEREELDGVVGSKSSIRLRASDIYSEDSDSESDEKGNERKSATSSRSSSVSEDEKK